MFPEPLRQQLTHRVTIASSAETYVVVRPGLALAMYYADPLHKMADAVRRMADAYLELVPPNVITALCGMDTWGPYSRRGLESKLKKLQSKVVNYTNIDMSSGSLLASEGAYGWHLNGGNLSNPELRPDDTNVVYHELPPEEIDRVGVDRLVEWAIRVAEIHPFETGQLGYSFNQLQRTWTAQADEFVGEVAMRFRGFDILEPGLARAARGMVPNCAWLNFLGERVIDKLGGDSAIIAALSPAVTVRRISGGLLLQAGERPPIGDSNGQALDLDPVREVARLTKPLRIARKVLFYGTEEFRNGWVHRFDER